MLRELFPKHSHVQLCLALSACADNIQVGATTHTTCCGDGLGCGLIARRSWRHPSSQLQHGLRIVFRAAASVAPQAVAVALVAASSSSSSSRVAKIKQSKQKLWRANGRLENSPRPSCS